ncbi:glycoside hydrolase family 16 protein [Thelephora terrestris]|uniref:Glycoside hydrolase family 16 protein n=1 Tax=Thelephora terrestris TaxID=56493 RepID=A0A9P6HDV7_9AGAM|nr:glycoside hydrolase family 16 protein [Thelephora terrestris]
MKLLTFFLISLLPLLSLARFNNRLSRQQSDSRRGNVARGTTYMLQTQHQGQNFFDDWDFFTGPDPTNGNVQYESQANAQDLAYVQPDGTAVLKVDNQSYVPPGGNRRSVRITSKETYNGGLFIADFWQFATGQTVWPAFWTVGPSWPNGGEIDIVEYVNTATVNQYTLHTGTGGNCQLNPNANSTYRSDGGSQPQSYLGTTLGTQCMSSNGNNAGCAVSDFQGSAGSPFNAGGGGVFAMLWDNSQISLWRFDRNQIPQDIQNGNPNPDGWGVPMAYWSSQSCDIANAFQDHSIVINISICGDWAGSAYNGGGSCSDAVSNAANYNNAQTKINYISVYQKA